MSTLCVQLVSSAPNRLKDLLAQVKLLYFVQNKEGKKCFVITFSLFCFQFSTLSQTFVFSVVFI